MASTLDVVERVRFEKDPDRKYSLAVLAAQEVMRLSLQDGKFDRQFLVGQIYKLAEASGILAPVLDPIETLRSRQLSWIQQLAYGQLH